MNPHAMSGAEAAARLRYAAGVRTRTRRAVLGPGLALLVLGAVVVVHAALMELWPHDAGVAASWLFALLGARLIFVLRRRRVQWRRGIVGAPHLRVAVAAAALAGTAAAIAVGANLLVSTISAVTAVAAYGAGIPSIAAAAVVTGAIGDVVLAEGVPRPTAELLFGVGLIAVGIASRVRERAER
jgi:hypothetical protein